MKKITRMIVLALIAALTILAITACGGGSDVPSGMQLVRGGDEVGYIFYAPEEWVVSNRGSISSAYISVTNGSSVSFTEAQMPEGDRSASGNEIPKFISDYYLKEASELPFPITTLTNGKKINLGNAEKAYSFVYSFEYGDEIGSDPKSNDYRCMQVYATYGERFFIFQYLAPDRTYMDGKTYYEFFLTEKVQGVMDNLKIIEKGDVQPPRDETERDEDGYLLVSDKTISGFGLYVPESFVQDYSSAIVSATDSEAGQNVTVSKITLNLGFNKYWDERKAAIEKIADKKTDENGTEVTTLTVYSVDDKATEHNGTQRVCMSYSYSLDGTTYYVYQAYVRSTWADYMYTFTSKAPVEGSTAELAIKILNKITF